jgi:predicted O-methyltransferase YrrM
VGVAGISLPLQTALGGLSVAMLNLGMPRTPELVALESSVTREFAQQALSQYGASQIMVSVEDDLLLQELASSTSTNGHANAGVSSLPSSLL